MLIWHWISLEREICWRWSLRTRFSQCHNNPVFVPPRKPPNPVKDLCDGQTYDLKTSVNIWTRIDLVPVEYGTFTQKFHLTMWFLQFITGITFKWNYLIGRIVVLLVWIVLWTKLRIYRVPPDSVRWSCRGFRFLWRTFMLNWMLWTNNDLKIFHRKQVNVSPNMKLVTFLINFECQSWWIFEGLSYHQEDEVIDPIIFAATLGLDKRIKKLISSNFMGMLSSVSLIFDTGANYSCSFNKGDFLKLDEKKFPRKLKSIAKGFEISGFVIVEYSV